MEGKFNAAALDEVFEVHNCLTIIHEEAIKANQLLLSDIRPTKDNINILNAMEHINKIIQMSR